MKKVLRLFAVIALVLTLATPEMASALGSCSSVTGKLVCTSTSTITTGGSGGGSAVTPLGNPIALSSCTVALKVFNGVSYCYNSSVDCYVPLGAFGPGNTKTCVKTFKPLATKPVVKRGAVYYDAGTPVTAPVTATSTALDQLEPTWELAVTPWSLNPGSKKAIANIPTWFWMKGTGAQAGKNMNKFNIVKTIGGQVFTTTWTLQRLVITTTAPSLPTLTCYTAGSVYVMHPHTDKIGKPPASPDCGGVIRVEHVVGASREATYTVGATAYYSVAYKTAAATMDSYVMYNDDYLDYVANNPDAQITVTRTYPTTEPVLVWDPNAIEMYVMKWTPETDSYRTPQPTSLFRQLINTESMVENLLVFDGYLTVWTADPTAYSTPQPTSDTYRLSSTSSVYSGTNRVFDGYIQVCSDSTTTTTHTIKFEGRWITYTTTDTVTTCHQEATYMNIPVYTTYYYYETAHQEATYVHIANQYTLYWYATGERTPIYGDWIVGGTQDTMMICFDSISGQDAPTQGTSAVDVPAPSITKIWGLLTVRAISSSSN